MSDPLILAGLWNALARNWALTSIAGAVCLLLLILAIIIAKYVPIALNIMQEVPPPLSMKVRDFRPLPGDDVEFLATDGLRLRGVLCLRPDRRTPARGMIVFAPEFKSDRESVARYCRPLWDAGYDLFSFDFRNHGESAEQDGYLPRQWCSQREVADMNGAFTFVEDYLRSEGRPAEFGLFGVSRGACAGVLAAAQRPSVRAIITDGVFSADRVLESLLRRYAEIFVPAELMHRHQPPEFWRFLRWCVFLAYRRRFGCVFPSVQKALSHMIPRPMLFVHGERDSYIRESQSRLLYAVAAQPKYLWVVPDAKHNQAAVLHPAEYARYTVDFFDHYLWNNPAPDNMYAAAFTGPLALKSATSSRPRPVESSSPLSTV